ncbi:MAG: hypothetical protein OXC62_14625 [Aestuariivita sp.]|nr:hypothetical protein [Aestuariivita sp.]
MEKFHVQVPSENIENNPNEPDSNTEKVSRDWTDSYSNVPDRAFYINTGILRYGTSDKVHGSSIVLSIFLLGIILLVIIIGLFSENTTWLESVFTWLGSAFLFVAGVAVGRSSENI